MDKILLIAENNPHMIYLLRMYAEKSGFQVEVAGNKELLLSMAGQVHPSAILIGMQLSGESSLPILPGIKALDCNHPIPVALCAWNHELINELPVGADAVLYKPIMYESFQEALQTLGLGLTQKAV